jgi:hypothetical protein
MITHTTRNREPRGWKGLCATAVGLRHRTHSLAPLTAWYGHCYRPLPKSWASAAAARATVGL